jgi:hypothetical protein
MPVIIFADALENSFYKYFMSYFLTPGVFLIGTDLTPAISSYTTITRYGMCLLTRQVYGAT